uniref:protein-serine/threonine phosphatase n=2 Tax=Anthurium amnicola TaxID=1678845 RepID=A0A1D1ZJW4_9ARAE
MGNGLGRFTSCLCGGDGQYLPRRRCGHHDIAVMMVSEPYDEGLGHSFCYVRPDPSRLSSSKVHHSEEDGAAVGTTTTTFRSISGASVSANTSTALSTSIVTDPYSYASGGLLPDRAAAAFDCSTSFSSVPLQPVPRGYLNSGPFSGPMDRGFMSGPIERGFMSGPLDRGIFSGPLDRSAVAAAEQQFQRSFSHGGYAFRPRSRRGSLLRGLRRAIARTITRGHNSIVAPIKGAGGAPADASVRELDAAESGFASSNTTLSSNQSLEDAGDEAFDNGSLQWAQGKAGEDRVHVVISEERGWVFVGIYDGFNGPDAPDYLLSNLYPAVHKELKGLLWDDDKYGNDPNSTRSPPESGDRTAVVTNLPTTLVAAAVAAAAAAEEDCCKVKGGLKKKPRGAAKKWEENQRRWKNEWDRERLELDRKLKEQLAHPNAGSAASHPDVLKALSAALRKTEEAYLDVADSMVGENPELALMGSCVLVMLMKGEDVYLVNVGDSRAVLAQKAEPDVWGSIGKARQDLERIKEETLNDFEACDGDLTDGVPCLVALQLTMDHSTSVEQEVQRIKSEHPDDASAVVNDRVKGSLKVTRAFGAGFLKQPKWNDALLEMFRIDYVGSSPYITCNPSLYHHRLGPKDRFLILSSDGLYQYFTNEEAVAEVEMFIASFPEGDPAQHLVEEVLFRAAKKAGMDFHELLEIPQGDRRRYHDDVSVIVISLEGRIWRYCV